MRKKVVVVGFATRHVAQSAFGAGYEVYAVDHFCDQDLSFYARESMPFAELDDLPSAVEEMCQRHKPDIMAVTAPGCLTLSGINSAGLSINMNLLRNQSSLEVTGGVPTHVMLRKVFMYERLGDAIAAIATAEGRSPKNYLLTSIGEGIIDIETTKTDLDVQYPEKDMLTHSNHFKAERFKSNDISAVLAPDTYIRGNRLYRLMEEHHGDITVDVMKQLMQDHGNYPNSICRHRDKNAPFPLAQIIKTLISIINVPEEKAVYVSLGNPCQYDYVEYRL